MTAEGSPTERVAVVGEIYESWARGDLSSWPEAFANEIEFESIADGRTRSVGREGIAQFMRAFLEQWDSFSIVAEEIESVGDTLIVTERQRGTGKTSGLAMEQTDYAAWTFRGDEIVRVQWEMERDRLDLERSAADEDART